MDVSYYQDKLDLEFPGKFQVLSYSGSDLVVVLDISRNVEFEYKFRYLMKTLRTDPNHIFCKTKAERVIEYQGVLDFLSPGRFRVLSFDGVRSALKLEILDINRNVVFKQTLASVRRKLSRDLNYLFSPSAAEAREKYRETCLDRYGSDSYSATSEFRAKYKDTCIDKFGVDHPMRNKSVAAKATENNDYSQANKTRAERSLTNIGVDHYMKILENRQRQVLNLKEKYGVTNPIHVPGALEKSIQTRKDLGIIKLYEGKTYREIAEEYDVPVGFVRKAFKNNPESAMDIIASYTPGGSSLTTMVSSWFDECVVNRQLHGTNRRPDVLFPDSKVIIECDGLYWHSELSARNDWNPDRLYHVRKRDEYEALGYRALFFRSDELFHKPDIVRSIVSNTLKLNEYRVQARKCDVIEDVPSEFFANNHLMGAGSGQSFGLAYEGQIVSAIRVKRIHDGSALDVSRFCNQMNTSVVGAYSRLISHVARTMKPDYIQTFIDRRYGSGSHLSGLGWEFVHEYPSFRWTDGTTSHHRMKFPGLSGYEHGMAKIWDCGQAKWVMRVK